MTLDELIYFSIFVASGIIVGVLFQRLITPMIKRIVSRTKWLADDLIIDSTSRWVIPWFIALGVLPGVVTGLKCCLNTICGLKDNFCFLYIFHHMDISMTMPG